MKKSFLFALALCGAAHVASAQGEPARWLRSNAISPDGSTIAFSYRGDIFTVPAKGGVARQITANSAYETNPLWSPDGASIVFTSTREGSADIYIVSAGGGEPKRLTTFPGSEVPMAFDAEGNILFRANIQPDAVDTYFPGESQVYSVPVQGGRPRFVTSVPMECVSVGKGGDMLYHDAKGYEDPFRKHHTSSVARDIWLCRADGTHTKLTDFSGEDRNPCFAADGNTFYFLSERSGSFNVYASKVDNPQNATQLTYFDKHPVRYLSAAADGTLAFSYNGDLYTLAPQGEPVMVDVLVAADNAEKAMRRLSLSSGASSLAISPSGKEMAYILRGDVFVSTIEYGTTRRITNTAEQERNVCFTPDGRSLVYSSERGGVWNIYSATIADKNEDMFTFAQSVTESPITKSAVACFQPMVSPDGKKIAYLQNRTTVMVADIDGKNARVVLDGKYNYSYSDGDQEFAWSPDSRYLLSNYIGVGGWHHSDVALIDVESGTVTDLTESGYSDYNMKWASRGMAMAWMSDRNGYRSHGSWGADDDVYVMFFSDAEYAKFRMTKEESELYKQQNDKKKKDADKDDEEGEAAKKPKKVAPLELDLANCADRVCRLTKISGSLVDFFLNADVTKLYYTVMLEKNIDLCVADLKDGSVRVLCKDAAGAIVPSPDEKTLYIESYSGIKKVDAASGSVKPVGFTGEFEYKPAAERAYIFDHAWQQVTDKFYDPNIHNIDWAFYRDNYRQFLPYITNNYDFAELLGEMLGELNASHTGARYRPAAGTSFGYLGAIFDTSYAGDGLKITEVVSMSPLACAVPAVEAGSVITAIDGHEIKAGADWFPLLTDKVNKPVTLTIATGRKSRTVTLRPISSGQYANLLYTRWVRRNEAMVQRLSGGRVAYVHVQGMDSPSFREVYSRLLGKYRNCEAVIVDTRHNGGGWLHDDLATLLSGKAYADFEPRGQFISTEPHSKWTKPSCVLVGEDNYSDAHGFPYVYKSLGIGKLIGAPVPGTMTAVWWERQIDPTLVFGIPQVGTKGKAEGRYLENMQLEPDILVYNTPESVVAGSDTQLERAVEHMLSVIGK